MQRLRVRYTKRGRVRFLSARDLTSVWERALRRAELPIAYSEGFTPHPKVSFPDALPVGYASTGEYAELTFAAPIDPGRGLGRLSRALPTGMDITTYVTVPDGARKLASYLQATLWELELGPHDQAAARHHVAELHRRIDAFTAQAQVEVVRHRSKGDTTVDLRPTVLAMAASLRDDRATDSGVASPLDEQGDPRTTPVLRAVFRNDGPTVRPSDLAGALTRFAGSDLPDPRLYTRVAQGTWTDDGLVEALTQQREWLDPGRQATPA